MHAMKILTASQVREADAYTIENEPVKSIALMERASWAFISWFISHFEEDSPVKIICGQGNNGGDGLAVARMLLGKEYNVKVFVVRLKESGSEDFEINFNRLAGLCKIENITSHADIPNFGREDIIIDAMFGSGLSRPVEGLYAEVIKIINDQKLTVVALDIASGLFSAHHVESDNVIKADYTISFQIPKLAFFMPENADYVGKWHLVDIGLHKNFFQHVATPYYYLTEEFIASLLKKRKKYSHKGDFGSSLIVSGSKGKMGAAVLCSKACLKTGAGLVTVFIPDCGYEILQVSVPEAMVITDEAENFLSSTPEVDKFDAIGIGPGVGTNEATEEALDNLLQKVTMPMVIDADALNILGKHKELLNKIPKNSILTPHPKEFERIAGKFDDDYERLALQKKFSKKYQVYLLIKGAHTSIATPDGEVYFNATGNPGMAKGGSGDVLTGMLTALLGQQYSPLEAVIIGVFIHGMAADKAAENIALECITASDIVGYISEAYKILHSLH